MLIWEHKWRGGGGELSCWTRQGWRISGFLGHWPLGVSKTEDYSSECARWKWGCRMWHIGWNSCSYEVTHSNCKWLKGRWPVTLLKTKMWRNTRRLFHHIQWPVQKNVTCHLTTFSETCSRGIMSDRQHPAVQNSQPTDLLRNSFGCSPLPRDQYLSHLSHKATALTTLTFVWERI